MSNLTTEEMQRYNQLTELAKNGKMTSELNREWQQFGERYAVQLEREGREHRALRAEQMQTFLAEKKAWAEARDSAREKGEEFNRPDVERDFNQWLQRKGLV